MRAFLITLCVGLLSLSHSAYALFGNNDQGLELNSANSFVPVDQAFPFNYYQQDGKVPYRLASKRGLLPLSAQSLILRVKTSRSAQSKLKTDNHIKTRFFGEVSIYTQPLFVQVSTTKLPRWFSAYR